MIARNNNNARSDNLVLLLLKQLQPHLNAPIDDIELVENMLRVEFENAAKLNLLYWVKILPVDYYHTILKVISVEVFQAWYKRLSSYQEEYAALSEEQKNEWELALFYYRDKFSKVFDKYSFQDVLERKEPHLDMLGWRLKRQPPLPLDVLAKLACLNYSATRAYVEIHIPDLKERIAFAEAAGINAKDKLISNRWCLMDQHHRWLEKLSHVPPKDVKKGSLSRGITGFLSIFSPEPVVLDDASVKKHTMIVAELYYLPTRMGAW